MYMKSMSWILVIALAPAVFLISSANYRLALQVIVGWTAAWIIIQAFRGSQYRWQRAPILQESLVTSECHSPQTPPPVALPGRPLF